MSENNANALALDFDPSNVFEPLLEAAPSFCEPWERFQEEYRSDDELPFYSARSELARHLTLYSDIDNTHQFDLDNNEKVLVALALDWCDGKTIAHVATIERVKSEDLQDRVFAAVENRFGLMNILPKSIEWPADDGSCVIA